MQEVVGIEEKVEVLGGLGQEEALHPVGQAVVSHILYSCIATGSSGGGGRDDLKCFQKNVKPGRVLNGPEDVETCLKQPGIPSCPIKVPDATFSNQNVVLSTYMMDSMSSGLRGKPSLCAATPPCATL